MGIKLNIRALQGDVSDSFTFDLDSGSSFESMLFSGTAEHSDGRLTVTLSPNGEVTFSEVSLEIPNVCARKDRLFFNGYQSWSFCKEFDRNVRLYGTTRVWGGEKSVRRSDLDRYGDSHFTPYSAKKGEAHGWSWCYFRTGKQFRLFASLSERSGYTKFSFNKRLPVVRVDKEPYTTASKWTPVDLAILTGTEDEVFDRWFEMMEIPAPRVAPMSGYTSWYNHYPNISDKIIADDLAGIDSLPVKADIFQIDDGWQPFVGDWLTARADRFPDGMKAQADAIHEKGIKAGLWLSPFICETGSEVFKNHPDWFVCDSDGKPYSCGSNWTGFYALDIYNEEVRAHLKKVFDTILNDWGYDMVKLDFLYGVCILPIHGKTRGEIMCDGMDFLREIIGDKLILGCGVPLMPSFGKVDFCRVGTDVDLRWDGDFRQRRAHPERVSTMHTLCQTVFRRQIDGRGFMNDPDVFLLRDYNIHLSDKQKHIVSRINGLFGSLLFTSDNALLYKEKQLERYRETCSLRSCEREVETKKRYFTVTYTANGRTYKIKVRTGK